MASSLAVAHLLLHVFQGSTTRLTLIIRHRFFAPPVNADDCLFTGLDALMMGKYPGKTNGRIQHMRKKKALKLEKKSALLVFLLISPVVYVAHILQLFLIDTYRGDGMMLYQYLYVSRRQLALQLISSGWHALPLLYATSALWLFVACPLTRMLDRRGVVLIGAAGALTGLVLAVLLIGKSIDAVVPFVLSGFLMACATGWLAHHARGCKGG